jgi:hypothetical protein
MFVTSCNTTKVHKYQHNKFIQSVISTLKQNENYIRVIEIPLALILVDGRGTITSKARTFVVLQNNAECQ